MPWRDEPGDTQPAREGFASIVFVAVEWSPPASVPRRGSGATGRPAARPSRSSTHDHTEPIHLVNQRRRMWIMAGQIGKWLRECTVPIRTSYRQAAESCNALQHSVITDTAGGFT